MKKLFWEDAYLKEFDATVVKVDGNNVWLDQTAFNGRGGGLPGDVGWLNDVRVVDSIKSGDDVIHLVEENSFKIGDKVHGKLDWEKRYKIMRMHTAAHVLIGVMSREGLLVTGNQLGYEESRMDFNMEVLDREKILKYAEEANKIIEKGGEVRIYFMKREEALKDSQLIKMAVAMPPEVNEWRIVDIGFDRQPDGGVHVKDLKEIGKIRITKFENKGKNNRRLYFSLE
ncbi:MAG: alanyl-tRNA editing protein [Candidatus Aenigmarchaeota archaeon]|nr:alanyl-tRNA editing protein [Candidatus Aenigmarchaeota archaeon]